MILLCANRAGRTRFVSLSAAIAFLAASATATLADIGIAARYPGDKNIASDPDVILADDFESYTSPSQLTTKWSGSNAVRICGSPPKPGNYYAGGKALEMQLPISTTEVLDTWQDNQSDARRSVFPRLHEVRLRLFSVTTLESQRIPD